MRALTLAPFAERCLRRLRRCLGVVYDSWTESRRLHSPEALATRLRALGAAMCAAVGAGLYDGFAEAQAVAPPLRCFEPEPAVVADYQDFYRRWQGLDAALRRAGAETYSEHLAAQGVT